MTNNPNENASSRFTRREIVAGALKTMLVASALPAALTSADAGKSTGAMRVINIMNFIRAEEPRESMDLIEPVRGQMALIKAHSFQPPGCCNTMRWSKGRSSRF